MKPVEIVVLIAVIVAFVAAVTVIILRKIKGKSPCDCGSSCASCGCCPHCKSAAQSVKTHTKQNN